MMGQELLVQYNAPSVITSDEIALSYMAVYYINERLGRLMARVVGNAEYLYIIYGWVPFRGGGGSWSIFEKINKV